MSFLSAESYIDEYIQASASERSDVLGLDEDKYEKLMEYARLIDEFIAEFESDTVSLDSEDGSGDLTIGFECTDMIMYDGRKNPFFEFLEIVDRVCFSSNEDGNMNVTLIIENLWRIVGGQKET